MTGDGCDELFGGYSFFFGLTREQLSRKDLDILVEQIGEAVSELIGDVKSRSILEKMNSVLQNGDT